MSVVSLLICRNVAVGCWARDDLRIELLERCVHCSYTGLRGGSEDGTGPLECDMICYEEMRLQPVLGQTQKNSVGNVAKLDDSIIAYVKIIHQFYSAPHYVLVTNFLSFKDFSNSSRYADIICHRWHNMHCFDCWHFVTSTAAIICTWYICI